MESFRIKPDDKLCSRLVSKESSRANPSFRVYYGDVCGAVPFTWESRPGTPKCTLFTHSQLPPLTPPPSYYFHSTLKSTTAAHRKPRSFLLGYVFARGNSHKAAADLMTSPSTPSSLSSLSWSTSYSSFSSNSNGRRRLSSRGSSFDDGGDEHQPVSDGSKYLKLSRFCFPSRRNINSRSSGIEMGNSAATIKKNFLSMIGCRSG